MRYDSEHKARTRQRVLKEASLAIREEGAGNIGVADIMARAGLTHGGFYAHFKSKDELIAEAITHMFEDRYPLFFSDIAEGDPRAALTTFIDHYLSPQHVAASRHGCPIPALASELPHLHADAQRRFAAGARRLSQALATLIGRAGLPDAETLARSALAELAGAVGLARVAEDEDEARAICDASRAAVKARLGL